MKKLIGKCPEADCFCKTSLAEDIPQRFVSVFRLRGQQGSPQKKSSECCSTFFADIWHFGIVLTTLKEFLSLQIESFFVFFDFGFLFGGGGGGCHRIKL